MSNVDLAKELVDIVSELDKGNWDIAPERYMKNVKRKVEIINALSNQMRDEEPKRDSFPEYGDAQGDLMEFVYKRFDGMPIAAIIGFLEMAKLSIIDEV
ncbi:coil containing protein [Vibrio phage 1.090.B._10N.286.48.F1]|nr:coil containing protein [Vibrio phage 1.090.B._10N.286.48.F1]